MICIFFAIMFYFCKIALAETLVTTTRASFAENSTTRYESFEEAIDFSNAKEYPQSPREAGEYIVPGTYSAYTFSQSGAKLVTVPNLENTNFNSQVTIVHATYSYSFGKYGALSREWLPVNGTHFVVQFTDSSESRLPYTFELPYDVSSVGGYWFCCGNNIGTDKIEIDLYDKNQSLIASEYVTAASLIDNDWSNNFAGWKTPDSSRSIRYVTVSCTTGASNAGLDMLMFSVPEPSTIALTIIAGLFSAFYFLLRKKSA